MVATVLIEELNTGSETATDKTSGTVRFKTADDAVVDTNARLIIPASPAREHSMRKMLRLNVTVASDTDIDNVQAYTDGTNSYQSPSTRVGIFYATRHVFLTPSVPSEANDPPQWPSAIAMSDLFTATSGTPINMDALTADGPWTSTRQIGDYLGLVMNVEPSAVQGTLSPQETLTFSFDET